MPDYTEEQHRAELEAAPVEEICDRLRGNYGPATYKPTPLNVEAARRLEEITALICVEEASLKVRANIDAIMEVAYKKGET